MRLILIRHGHPDVPSTGPTANPPLSARGQTHAHYAAQALRKERVDRIISSGMQRADGTAQPLADALGLPIERQANLGEVDRLGGAYQSIETIRARGSAEWERFLDAPLAYFGVNPDQFRAETLAAFRAVTDKAGDSILAIFTHGFPINILLSHALGIQHDARFVPYYGSITRLSGKNIDALTVVSINECGHIPAEHK
jgi:broad specificity phosphatase PhoE